MAKTSADTPFPSTYQHNSRSRAIIPTNNNLRTAGANLAGVLLILSFIMPG